MHTGQKDNTTLRQKVALRRNLLAAVPHPRVLESHGGWGHVYEACYREMAEGVVFETDPAKAGALARQRPTWAVYASDCVRSLRGGAGSHLPITVLDCDPYGDPWPVMRAFFGSDRPFPSVLGIVVNDGLRQKLKLNGAWTIDALASIVEQYGNAAMYDNYLDVCRTLIDEIVTPRGYAVSRWAGYYCGFQNQMTHYAAVLQRSS